MTPLINGEGYIKALEFQLKLAKTGPDAQVAWSLGEAWDYFLRGKAILPSPGVMSAHWFKMKPVPRLKEN